MRNVLRPHLSTKNMGGLVNMKSTMPRTPVARREVVEALRPRLAKMVGA
jgi:hypothetical protein